MVGGGRGQRDRGRGSVTAGGGSRSVRWNNGSGCFGWRMRLQQQPAVLPTAAAATAGCVCAAPCLSQQLPHSCDFSRPTTSTSSCMDATQTTPPSHAVCSPPHTHLPSAPLFPTPPPPTRTYTGARGAPGCGGLRQLPRPAGGGCGAAGGGRHPPSRRPPAARRQPPEVRPPSPAVSSLAPRVGVQGKL